MIDILNNIEILRKRIAAAARGREVLLLPVTKTQPAEAVNILAQAGITQIGENRIQEWLEKQPKLNSFFRLHMIGQLQTNKVRAIIKDVQLIHSVDRPSLLREIEKQAQKAERKVDILLQVNIAGEVQKGGVAPGQIEELLEMSQNMPHVRVRGLMTVAPFYEDPERTRPVFAHARELFDRWSSQCQDFSILSMGMSGDAMVAIEEGSTLVRIGSSIFGPRLT